jgi:hypothetical protein
MCNPLGGVEDTDPDALWGINRTLKGVQMLDQRIREQFHYFTTVQKLAQVPTDLLNAVQVIKDRGWVQGHYEASDGRVCALGALRVACGTDANRPGDTYNFDSNWLIAATAFHKVHAESLLSFNDNEGRTTESVIAAIEETAKTVDEYVREWTRG